MSDLVALLVAAHHCLETVPVLMHHSRRGRLPLRAVVVVVVLLEEVPRAGREVAVAVAGVTK